MNQDKAQRIVWMTAFIAIFSLLLILGTKLFFGLIVPEAQTVSQLGILIVLGFAFLAGIAAFFSPCPFAVFPSYIVYYLHTETEKATGDTTSQWRHALKIGSIVSLGIFSFYFAVGIILSIFGAALASYTNWLKLAIIPIFFILGAVLITGRSFNTKKLDVLAGVIAKRAQSGRHFLNMYLYGIVYGIAAASCHLPILLILALFPILAGNFIAGFAAFVVYAFGASLMLIMLTILASQKKNFLIKNLGLYGQRVKVIAGVIFILTGIYLLSFYLLV